MSQHVETSHEGIHYPCSQWDYKGTTNEEAINELFYYSCNVNIKDTLSAKSSLFMKAYVTHSANVIIEQQMRAILRKKIKHR